MPSHPVDPYSGPTSLDREIDSRLDPWADELPRGAPERAERVKRKLPTKELGELDRKKLRAALDDHELWEKARADFEDMLSRIDPQFGDFTALTDRQRAYVDGQLEKLGISVEDPAERNANVPRGREVQTAWKQAELPLAPPGRRPSMVPRDRCSLAMGGTEESCLACEGSCPNPPAAVASGAWAR